MSDYEYWDTYTGEPLSDYKLHDRYDEYLEEYGEGVFPDYPYSYDRVLKQVDPTAYRCGFNDWLDGELSDGVITDQEPDGE